MGYWWGMTEIYDDGLEERPDPRKQPAPGGPNDPGASASDENDADTPGYSGGGDDDPTSEEPRNPLETVLPEDPNPDDPLGNREDL